MITLRLLGTADLTGDGTQEFDALLRQPKPIALLAYLATAAPRDFHPRDTLLAMFWPALNGERARHALRQGLHVLRRELGEQAILTRGDVGVALNREIVSSDLTAFEKALAQEDYAAAVEHYRGEFLAGLFISDAPPFEQWVEGERNRLARAYRKAMERLAEQATLAGDPLSAVSWWRRVSEQDPYSTRVALRLMEALEAAGDRAGALQYAERHAARLEKELGAEPAPDVVVLAARLRAEPVGQQVAPDMLEAFRTAVAERYAIERELGRGGMATVYLANDRKHDRQVAIKVLKPELAASMGGERFLREIGIAAQLNHPNILTLIDSGEAGGFLYYVMPYVEGESLRDRLRREGQLGLEDAVQITCEVADGLSHAHSLGVIHRDIKPENILLSGGHAVVADFGIARAVAEAGGERLTETGLVMGTPAYMSPEQGTQQSPVDARSDLYSLGCVLYEMLAGDPPFTGSSAQAILVRKTVDPVPRLRVVRRGVSEAVEQVVLRALERAPGDRYGTVQQFTQALRAAATGAFPVASRRRGLVMRWSIATATTVLVLVAAWWGLGGVASSGVRIERIAVLPFDNLMRDAEQDYLVDGMHDAVIGELAQIQGLTVISRSSVLRYRNADKSIPVIAQDLGVQAVLEGSVLRAGDSVRIQIQLIGVDPERHLLARAFEESMRDVLQLQREVSRAIATEIRAELTTGGTPLAPPRPVDPEAYEAFLRGQHQLYRLTPDALRRATEYLEEAIAIDSTYAPAYAELAAAYVLRSGWWGDLSATDGYPRAQTAVDKALRLDSSLVSAYVQLGTIRWLFNWDWSGAEAAFRRALELNPNVALAHAYYGNFLRSMKRFDEALVEARKVIELDPVLVGGWAQVYLAQWDANQSEGAEEAFAQMIELDPDSRVTQFVSALARLTQRDFQGAAEAYDAAALPERAAATYALAGMEAEARARLRQLYEAPKPQSVQIAIVHATLGDTTEAIEWLERAYRERDADMVFLSYHERDWNPLVRGLWDLRSHPRVAAIFGEMNFPR